VTGSTSLRRGGLGRFELSGKVVVIAGATGGIGAACARACAEEGARVVLGYHRRGDRAAALADELPGDGHTRVALALADTPSLAAAAAGVMRAHGRCDVLINAAGFTVTVPHTNLNAMDDETFDRILTTNVRGSFALVREFADALRAAGDSVVVSVSSIAGVTGLGSSIAYCASKAAVDVMTLSLARALAPQVRVIGVSPAAVATDFVPGRGLDAIEKQAASTPLRIVVDPSDVAVSIVGAITHARLTTGTNIVIDGGRHL